MSRLLVSTVWRGVEWSKSGVLFDVDSDTSSVNDVFYLNQDDKIMPPKIENAGHRSARGLCWWNGYLWAAGYNFVACLEVSPFRVVDVFYSDRCLDIHHIYTTDNGIRIVSTHNNSLFIFDGHEFKKEVDITTMFLNERPGPDTLHLNTMLENLGLLCTYSSSQSAIVDINTGKVIFNHNIYKYGHDLIKLPSGELLSCASGNRKVLKIKEDGSDFQIVFDYDNFKVGRDSKLSRWGWLRGLCYIPEEDVLYVGAPPATLLKFLDVSGKIEFCNDIKLYEHVDLGFTIDLSVFCILKVG